MENVLDILTKYKEKGIRIGLDGTGEKLSIKGELSGLSESDKVELRTNKELLLSFLQGQKNVALTRTKLNIGDQVALSPGQKGIWLHSLIEEDDTMYLIPSTYDLVVSSLKQEDLLSAAQVFAEAHPILACVFREKDGQPYQELTEFIPAKHLFFEDLSQLSAPEKEAQCADRIRLSMQHGFDLSNQAPWSITVFNLGNDQYRFFVKIHHLIADGATLGLLVDGLVETYRLQQQGHTYHYTGAHHHDYVSWITDKTHQQRSSNFWKTYLEHYPEDLQLPSTDPDPEAVSATTVEQSLSTMLSEKAAHFSAAHTIPLSQLFTFSFGVVLSKHGRQNDLIIGTPVEGRTQSNLQNMLGDLVNTVPIRLTLNYEVSTLENLQTFGKGYFNVLEHQQYPFEYILDDIDYQRQADRFPLFNTMVSFPNNQEFGIKNENELKIVKEQALYDLTLSVIELANSIELQLEYDKKKFTAEYATGLLEQTLTVLDQVVSSAQTALSEISLLSASEQKTYLEKGLPKLVTMSTYSTVVEFITSIISADPKATAVVEGETTYSYAALQLKSQAIARKLQQKGITPGDRVVVELPSGTDLLAAMLGIWQIGGVYVPIGTELPTTRKEEILQDSGAVIIIDTSFIQTLSHTTDQRVEQSTEDLAYILYTSGSTGKPKGVAVSHGALLNKMMEEATLIKTAKPVTLTLTSPTFDVSLLELILPLTLKGTVVVQQDKSNAAVFESIFQNKVTVLQGTPTYFSHLESELDESAAQSLNKILQLLCIGGESLNDALVRRLKKKLPDVRINNHYGPTEITIDALVKEDVNAFKQNSLGQPFGNTGAFIVDDYDNLLPQNVPGELLITGPSLATGYWNNEVETEAKFSSIEKLGLFVYKTGDLATWSKDGEIHFIGRKDKQVKYRGYRIELEEINARLREIFGIRDAYTLVISNVLISWVAIDNMDESSIREDLQQTLPEYMIPTVYEQLTTLPMNANGKVDEKQLPPPNSLKAEYVAPRNELEEQLAQIWQEVLGVERVGIYDNFFELGGNSLNMIDLGRRISHKTGLDIPFKEILQRNISDISKHLETSNLYSKMNNPEVLLETNEYPLSPSQKNLIFYEAIDIESSNSNVALNTRIRGEIDINLFARTLDYLINSNDSLRISLHQKRNGEFYQKLNKPETFDDYFFHTRLPETLIPDEFDTSISEKKFDLRKAPLFEVQLTQYGEEVFDISFAASHLILDGYSLMAMEHEFVAVYQTLLKDDQLDLESLTQEKPQYTKYVIEESNLRKSEKFKRQKGFWYRQFEDNNHIFSIAQVDKSTVSPEGLITRYQHVFSPLFLYALEKKSKELKVSIPNLFHAFVFLAAYTIKQEDKVTIGSLFSGRDGTNLNMLGMTLNSVVLRCDFHPSMRFDNFLRQVNDLMYVALENQNFQYEDLVKMFNKSLEEQHMPFTDIYMNVIGDFKDIGNRFFYTSAGKHVKTNIKYKYDILVNISDNGSQISCDIEYRPDTLSKELIEKTVERIESYVTLSNEVSLTEIVQDSLKIKQNLSERHIIQVNDESGYIAFDHYHNEHLNNKPTLVFVHGWCCNGDYWISQVNAFKDYYNILVLHLLYPVEELGIRNNLSLENQCEDIIQSINAAGVKDFLLIGHSSADNLILSVADVLPERTKAIIGIDNMWGIVSSALSAEEYYELIEKPYRGNFKNHLNSRIGDWLYPNENQARLHRYIYEQMTKVDEDSAMQLANVAYMTKSDLLYKNVQCPVSLICSDYFKEIELELIENGILRIDYIEGTSHFPFLESPKEFNRVLSNQLEQLNYQTH